MTCRGSSKGDSIVLICAGNVYINKIHLRSMSQVEIIACYVRSKSSVSSMSSGEIGACTKHSRTYKHMTETPLYGAAPDTPNPGRGGTLLVHDRLGNRRLNRRWRPLESFDWNRNSRSYSVCEWNLIWNRRPPPVTGIRTVIASVSVIPLGL